MADTRDERTRAEADRLMEVVTSTGSQPDKALPATARVYRVPAPEVDVAAVATALARWYEQKRMHVQILPQGGVYTVQSRSPAWRRALGMAVALTVVLHREGGDLVVEMGSAPWAERAAFAAVGTQLPVLLATAAWGQWEQTRLPEQSLQYIRSITPTSTTPDTPPLGDAGAVRRSLVQGWRSGAARLREAMAPSLGAAPTVTPPGTAARPPAAGPAASHPSPDTAAQGPAAKLDVNTATEAQLSALPGIDAEAVAAIVRARAARGGTFASRVELERAAGLKPHVVVRLRDLVEIVATDAPARPRATGRRVVDL
jgi:DNA uptake protein ComE-like DNA-binding protein